MISATSGPSLTMALPGMRMSKDAPEGRLRDMVCRDQLDLATAQREIAREVDRCL